MKKEYSPRLNYPEMEREVLQYWENERIYERMREKIKAGKKFTFLEGPPTANGLPHLGHALTRAVKDVVLRYHAMSGENVFPWIGGWDCHGLPVELEVEKSLKINSKKEIENFGIKEFNLKCKESVFKYKKEWEWMTKRIGFWIDLENAYVTMEDKYIESVWWALKRMWDMGLLEKDYKIVPYCPRCGTPLSSHEVSQGYKETEDPSVYVKFKCAEEDAYFLVWTTTPWTLPSNMFLAVNENLNYLLLEEKEKYYVAEEAAGRIFNNPKILKRMKGSELIGKRYERPVDVINYNGKGFYVVSGDFVTVEEGTGIVHIAPAFGADDFEIGKSEGIRIINPVDREGRFSEGPWQGKFVKDADKDIINYLRKKGLLFRAEKIKHTYPFCWRCGTPLLYYPLDTWFIKVSLLRDKLIENNNRINWIPDHLKEGRFGNFLTEAKDWALSRDRYWGTPLPVWKCENGHYFVPSSFNDLLEKSESKPEYFEPHRPWVDELVIKCPVCGKEMKREPYVIDVWFDSGSSTFAQFHYPFENFDKFPVDFITEAIDQTRGWFYTLHVINSILFNSNAYKNVLTLGFVLNEKGEKMSKSRGDVVDPMEWMESLGADAIRLYMFSMPPWRDRRISQQLVKDYRSRTIETLWNSYVFFMNNATLDGFRFDGGEITNKLDFWIISRLNSTIKCIKNGMDNYEINRATECIEKFIGDLSNWYIRRSRRRFWEEKITPDKLSGYRSLYVVFRDFTRAIAPFVPFISDYIYMDLTGEKSVHLSGFPQYDENLIDTELENEMEILMNLVELGRRARQIANIKVRQPLEKMIIVSNDNDKLKIVKENEEIIMDELNIKGLEYADENRYIRFKVKLNPTIAGPILKEKIKEANKELENLDIKTIKEKIKSGKINLIGTEIPAEAVILEEEVDPSFVIVHGNGLDVIIKKEISKDLYYEGLAREIVRRIQMMRKEMDLKYDDRVEISLKGDDDIQETLKRHGQYIKNETLSTIVPEMDDGYVKEWNIEEKKIIIKVKKV